MNWLSVRSALKDILTFVDTHWYTLKFISSMVKGCFQFVEERSCTLLFRTECRRLFMHAQNCSVCAKELSLRHTQRLYLA